MPHIKVAFTSHSWAHPGVLALILQFDCRCWECVQTLIRTKETNPILAQYLGLGPNQNCFESLELWAPLELELEWKQHDGPVSRLQFFITSPVDEIRTAPPHARQWIFSSQVMIRFSFFLLTHNSIGMVLSLDEYAKPKNQYWVWGNSIWNNFSSVSYKMYELKRHYCF